MRETPGKGVKSELSVSTEAVLTRHIKFLSAYDASGGYIASWVVAPPLHRVAARSSFLITLFIVNYQLSIDFASLVFLLLAGHGSRVAFTALFVGC
jgi:hypothetical protein